MIAQRRFGPDHVFFDFPTNGKLAPASTGDLLVKRALISADEGAKFDALRDAMRCARPEASCLCPQRGGGLLGMEESLSWCLVVIRFTIPLILDKGR